MDAIQWMIAHPATGELCPWEYKQYKAPFRWLVPALA
jgi:hypothetical protein